jgi:hypothetical protein
LTSSPAGGGIDWFNVFYRRAGILAIVARKTEHVAVGKLAARTIHQENRHKGGARSMKKSHSMFLRPTGTRNRGKKWIAAANKTFV